MWPSAWPKWPGGSTPPAPGPPSPPQGNRLAARLLFRTAQGPSTAGGHQGGDALHPDPHPRLIEALRDTDLAAIHKVTQVTQDAERMASPQFRAHTPPTVAPTSWAALRREVAAERRTYEALLEPMHLAEQADPEMAEKGFRRLRTATQQHREALLEMLVKSDASPVARDPMAGNPADAISLPMSPSALR